MNLIITEAITEDLLQVDLMCLGEMTVFYFFHFATCLNMKCNGGRAL